ncbi:hypothetical protein HBF26_16225 [Luteibacter jiangsuensis]|uniref:Uncharacterized protein n=1 Tax=Luteibacter jiangsuensis TaxID=637577 RepID=A0ABX0Q7B3_9GAMM|nr:hypothetical protein [Luteibacter jiangsuensis]NID06443.1 hypothetical protein [Luteibacter jiangsuensis]
MASITIGVALWIGYVAGSTRQNYADRDIVERERDAAIEDLRTIYSDLPLEQRVAKGVGPRILEQTVQHRAELKPLGIGVISLRSLAMIFGFLVVLAIVTSVSFGAKPHSEAEASSKQKRDGNSKEGFD